ncbi:MAG: RluA family pseudouridine synthase [Candidatus Taylorbacteria bacterium]|nr:RluA family pseudouridine synthase [Candidatus Taylorbacteria bacterium]
MVSIPILYEDNDVLVLDKPAGLIVHPDGKTKEPALTDWILEQYPEIKGVGDVPAVSGTERRGPALERSGIVHRLDRETSGALVVAKTQEAFLFLKKQFQAREMGKVYRTFVYGSVKHDHETINRPIARSSSDFRKWTAMRGKRGEEREAITFYSVIARHRDVSFLEVRPQTGRTHQIRVHLKAINHPVMCDALYAPNKPSLLGFSRLALHAFSITFTLLNGKEVTVEAPYPADFKKALHDMGQREPAE